MQTNNIRIGSSVFDLASYQFDLPGKLIAQYPVEPRDSSRLMVLNRTDGATQDRFFSDIIEYLNPGDTLVLNKTRVMAARLLGHKTSGAQVEILLLRKTGSQWEALVKPARRVKPGMFIDFSPESDAKLEIVEELDIPGGRLVAFVGSEDEEETIARLGKTPLPPYINRPAEEIDRYRYQTVYAVDNGSAAAPTAGLHFTTQLLDRIKAKGINITYILLHIGLGTFRPVESQDIRRHQMHSEYYQIEPATAKILNNTRESGGRIIAVGTTSVRTLESACDLQAGFLPQQGETNIFIYPGYKFKAVDGLITNFHLPGSSLIMLVAALAGLDNTLAAYHRAIKQEYRFFSYGDAMLII